MLASDQKGSKLNRMPGDHCQLDSPMLTCLVEHLGIIEAPSSDHEAVRPRHAGLVHEGSEGLNGRKLPPGHDSRFYLNSLAIEKVPIRDE